MPAKTNSNLFTYVDSILSFVVIVFIYRNILTINKDGINTSILLLERARDIINKINTYKDINNISKLSKNSNDETLVNIRVILSRLRLNKRFIRIYSNKSKLDFYLYKA